MCGCMDMMPVDVNAACTKVTDNTFVVDITCDSTIGAFNAKFTMGTIGHGDCGDLNSYIKTLVTVPTAPTRTTYMDTRIVGDGGCHGAINDFLAGKELVKTE